MINKVNGVKSKLTSITTMRKANKRMMNSAKRDAIKNIAHSYVARKAINPNEPLPADEVVKVFNKRSFVSKLFPSLFDLDQL